MTVDISDEYVARQSALPGNKVSFEAALRAAMTSYLEDSSPLQASADVVQAAAAQLRKELNRESTRLRLLGLDQRGQHGETVRENWIFFLQRHDEFYYDCGFWAVVDRSGAVKAYNYGFSWQ